MAIPQSATLLHHLRQTVLRRDGAGLSDGQLLRCYLYQDDGAAFEALLRRHGPMVRGVCRRILRNVHDADDAFQAAFLVLLRKAPTLAAREVIGDWLHGVAYRTALKARTAAARRRWKEQQTPRREAIVDEPQRAEWLPLLDQEISRLPPKYRLPVLLCDLEGRTHKDAAKQLGWPEGSLSGRLSRARAMLARRLIRRGVTLSAAALATGLTGEAAARLPFSLVGSTCKAAREFAVSSAAGSVPAHVASLTEGVVKAMFVAKLKKIAVSMMALLILAAGAGAWRYAAGAGQTEEPRAAKSLPPKAAAPKAEERMFRIDLRLTREENGQRKALAYPRMIAPELKEVDCGMGPSYAANCGKSLFFLLDMGPSVRLKVGSYGKGKGRLDMTVNQPGKLDGDFDKDTTVESRSIRVFRWIDFGQPVTVKLQTGDKKKSVLEVTAVIQEIDQGAVKDPETTLFPAEDPSQSFGESYGYSAPPARGSAEWKQQEAKKKAKMLAAAEKDLQIAEFYRRGGHADSARFYYELISLRYPGTKAAKRATQQLAEKPAARVGQVFIFGNEKTSDRIILEQVPFYPGGPLNSADIREAERNLSRLKCFKSKPKVEVLDREGDNVYRDIRITVEEK